VSDFDGVRAFTQGELLAGSSSNTSILSRGEASNRVGAVATVRRRFGVAILGDSNQQIHSIHPLEAV
jgi:hypothetical protein